MHHRYNSSRKRHRAMPKTRDELIAILNSGRTNNKYMDACAKLKISRPTMASWMKYFDVKRVYHYE